MKRIISLILAAVVVSLCLFACSTEGTPNETDGQNDGTNAPSGNGGSSAGSNGGNAGGSSNGSGDAETEDPTGRYTKFDLRASYDETEAVKITFSETSATVEGKGAEASGTTVSITRDGTYIISGSCSDGRIIVEVPSTDKVQLVLAGLKLTSKSSAPIWIKGADKTSITLADGTVNSLADTGEYTDANVDGEPNACLFSKDDLTINGTGSLEVTSNVNNGITSKDDLKIVSGTITVNAQNHGIRGNDSVSIRGGTITVSAKNDGIKSSQEEKEDKGYIYIDGGTISIDAGDDCLQAPRDITITADASVSVDAGGKQVNCDGTTNIAEGALK